MTGIPERQEQLEAVYNRVFGIGQAGAVEPNAGEPPSNGSTAKRSHKFRMPAKSDLWSKPYDQLTDDDLLQIAREAKNSDKFRRLWDGDTSDYNNDRSRADSALCCILAYWCQKVQARVDRLFRQSKLMRPKWDEIHYANGSTYGEVTVKRACTVCTKVYPGAEPDTPDVEEWLASAAAPQATSCSPPSDPDQTAQAEEDTPQLPHRIICEYFREHYRPVFRVGNAIYSDALHREVKASEACFSAPFQVLVRLAKARKAPLERGSKNVDWNALPVFFRNWAPVAWRDMLDALPDEQATAEISTPAMEEFHAKLAGALLTFVALAYTHRGGDGDQDSGERTDVQRRPLLHWARAFAKPKQWGDVRGYYIWAKLDGVQGLRVAIRCELFRQLHCFDLAKMSQTHFTEVCKLYGLGKQVKVRGGNARAVEFTKEFLADLLDIPADDEVGPGQTDGQEPSHRGAREENAQQTSGGDVSP